MKMRKGVLYALIAAACACPIASEARVYATVGIAPPPPRVEVVPTARRGHVWAPGYWEWRGRHHVWVKGHWVPARVGYRWVPHHWVERNGRWYMERGHWER
jgi:hypothetical protein